MDISHPLDIGSLKQLSIGQSRLQDDPVTSLERH